MSRVTIRLSESEAKALEQLPGKNTSARVRYLLHQSSLVGAIRAEIVRENGVQVDKIAEHLARFSPVLDTPSVREFRVALAMIAQLISLLAPVEKKQLATKIGEKILAGDLPTPGAVRNAMQSSGPVPPPGVMVAKTDHPPRPATGMVAAGADVACLDEIFPAGGAK